MHPDEYAKMYRQESSYWWFQGRKDLLVSLLEDLAKENNINPSSHVIDLGCGTGLVRAGVENLPLADESADLAVALDLAEHIPDDTRLFSEIHRILKPGGQAILTVPAHPFLWSDHDAALYHQRRYRKQELRQKLEESGLRIERMTYCISATFPLIVGFRLLQRAWQALFRKPNQPQTHLIMLPQWLNTLLRMTVQVESHLLRYMNLPFGVTFLVQASRPQAQ
ncbi:MAG: class I SAM-dependent methyltransferase [Candidatus Sumerlaeota bacterium]